MGVILVDICFDFDKVWVVMMFLFELIVILVMFDIYFVIEFEEFCMSKGYFIKYGVYKEDECNLRVIYEVCFI